MFQSQYTEIGGHSLLSLSHPNGAGMAILPALGGRLHSLSLRVDDKVIPLFMMHSNEDDIGSNPYALNSALIPFPNRLRDGRYEHEGITYQFRINSEWDQTAIHGLIRDRRFEVESFECGNAEARCNLIYTYHGSETGYPWPFQVRFTYTVNTSNEFTCETEILNQADSYIPMGSGWHHYLSFPDGVDHVELKLPPSEQIMVNERKLPIGERLMYEDFQNFTAIGDKRFDTGFKLSDASNLNYVELKDPKRGLHYQVKLQGGRSGYKFYQLFNHPSGQGLAVEPMTCNIDAFNNGEGLINMAPGETVSHLFKIKLHKYSPDD